LKDFMELHGDRAFRDDKAIIAGLAKLDGQKLLVIGQQKGRDTKENLMRTFGCAHPEGYRKAMRAMELAQKFDVPILIFIDTPGAYPGIGAEERGQAQAIALNLKMMAGIRVPIVAVVIGEGGSGGALGIGIADKVCVLENAYYSVISPEGCASILWKSAGKAPDAAETLGITATRLKTLGLVDKIISEPLGGAHRDYAATMQNVKKALQDALKTVQNKPVANLLQDRFNRLMSYGKFKEVTLQ